MRQLIVLLLARHAALALVAPRAPSAAPSAARSAAAAAGRGQLSMKIQRRASGRAARSEKGGIAAVARTTARARERREPERVFFQNAPYDAAEDELKRLFEAVGPVRKLRLTRDRFTRASRGFGFVTYREPVHATVALDQLQGAELRGRALRVGEATNKREQAKASSRRARATDRPDAAPVARDAPSPSLSLSLPADARVWGF